MVDSGSTQAICIMDDPFAYLIKGYLLGPMVETSGGVSACRSRAHMFRDHLTCPRVKISPVNRAVAPHYFLPTLVFILKLNDYGCMINEQISARASPGRQTKSAPNANIWERRAVTCRGF